MNTAGAEWCEVENLEEAMPVLDILYMTRVQKERFFNEEDYVRLKDSYILELNKLKTAKKDLSIKKERLLFHSNLKSVETSAKVLPMQATKKDITLLIQMEI